MARGRPEVSARETELGSHGQFVPSTNFTKLVNVRFVEIDVKLGGLVVMVLLRRHALPAHC